MAVCCLKETNYRVSALWANCAMLMRAWEWSRGDSCMTYIQKGYNVWYYTAAGGIIDLQTGDMHSFLGAWVCKQCVGSVLLLRWMHCYSVAFHMLARLMNYNFPTHHFWMVAWHGAPFKLCYGSLSRILIISLWNNSRMRCYQYGHKCGADELNCREG